ncbi:MAG TPA: hypothetical protein VIU33_04075, partial [Nitrospiria bacterium]
FKKLESGFLTSGNFLEQGTTKFGGSVDLKITSEDRILARFDKEEFSGVLGQEIQSLEEKEQGALQWHHEGGRWGLIGEYQYEKGIGRSTGKTETQGLAAAQLRFNLTDELITRLEHQQTVSGPQNNQSTLGVEYQILSALSLQGKGTQGTNGRAAEGGAVLTLGKNRLYLTERVSDDLAGRTTSTILGNEAGIGSSGKIYSEYQWERSDEGNRNLSLVGAQKEWPGGKGLKFRLAGEFSEIDDGGPDSRRYTMAPGVSYGNSAGLKAAIGGELRRQRGGSDLTQYLTSNHLELKLNPDFTLLGKFRFSITRNHDAGKKDGELEERSIGLAYRPINHDRLNALARFTRVADQQPFSLDLSGPWKTALDVASIEWSLEITPFLEWVEKEAVRIKREKENDRGSVKTRTYLSIHRLNLQIFKPIDLGLEYRMLRQLEAGDQKEGWLAELMWQAAKHFRFGLGYNFTDFSDNEFSDNDYSVKGWFFRGQATF